DCASGMLYAEGHPSPDGLCAPGKLAASQDALVAALLAADVPLPNGRSADVWLGPGDAVRESGFAGVRRLDSTLDLKVSSSAEGLAIMAGVAAVARDAPRGMADVWFAADGSGVETVYFRGPAGKKVLGRWYDKGREAATAPRGTLLRPEDQRRYVKGTRRDVTELSASYVRGKFHQRFYPLYQASKGVTVAGPIVLAEKLAQAVEDGELTATQAEKVAGHLLLQAVADRSSNGVSSRTRRRRRAVARELGLVLADGVLQEVEVDLHDVLDQCMDAGAWGCDQ
ncbi:MAG TPA: hypothetical protein VGW11_12840, partial [Solirubrobacteraceae bacterium]|nr:hypothetical protein [Solirubrobacteraceae bacterium]